MRLREAASHLPPALRGRRPECGCQIGTARQVAAGGGDDTGQLVDPLALQFVGLVVDLVVVGLNPLDAFGQQSIVRVTQDQLHTAPSFAVIPILGRRAAALTASDASAPVFPAYARGALRRRCAVDGRAFRS